jgi:hypothetical protein
MSSLVDDLFTNILYGAASWFGILIFLSLIIGLLFKWKESIVLLLPVSVLIGLNYMTNGLGWHALIMFLTAIFLLFYGLNEVKNRR